MIRTQILLPDELYNKAKQFASDREISLAELTRRSLENMLDRYPEQQAPVNWKLSVFDAGNIRVDLSELKSIAVEEEIQRSLS